MLPARSFLPAEEKFSFFPPVKDRGKYFYQLFF